MIIAVDFDGTIVDHHYPAIGPEKPFAIETLKKLVEEQHRVILWTVREGKLLEDAVRFCRERGLEFYAVNRNYPEEECQESRKLNADLWIDDKNLGGLPEWGTIFQMVQGNLSYHDIKLQQEEKYETYPKQGFFKRLFCKMFILLCGIVSLASLLVTIFK
jgi:hydroxymethylpyrimidine pyrophosphatase-like HAD family hydrolase